VKEVITLGEFLAPLIPYQTPPPIAPIANEAPKSEKMTYGLQLVRSEGRFVSCEKQREKRREEKSKVAR
jgi:hypothetical protein